MSKLPFKRPARTALTAGGVGVPRSGPCGPGPVTGEGLLLMPHSLRALMDQLLPHRHLLMTQSSRPLSRTLTTIKMVYFMFCVSYELFKGRCTGLVSMTLCV